MEENKKSLEIKIDPEVSRGQYCNLVAISHSESDFVFDFIFVEPQAPKGRVFSRVITSPRHAKRFLKALSENIAGFESRHGDIQIGDSKETPNQGMDYYN